MILVKKGIFTYFLVAPLGIGVSNSNGGKNEADALVLLPDKIPVLQTQPINRQTADFEGLTADKNFGKIGCRFLVQKMSIFADF